MCRLAMLTAVVVLACAACSPSDQSSALISLPAGDVDRGQAAFVELQCTSCHEVNEVDLPPPERAGPVRITLGTRLTRVKSHGDLVTSVVNPSHRLIAGYRDERVSKNGESLMTNYNDVMTVTQLVDIVAFLEAHYDVQPIARYRYPVYSYGEEEDDN
jgi:L-cysteine S-thiosulfotransferase